MLYIGTPPKLTEQDRKEALEKAIAVRQRRAQTHQAVAAGEMSMADALALDDEASRRDRVGLLLRSIPGVGKAKCERMCSAVGARPDRRVSSLSPRQRKELAALADEAAARKRRRA